jgi:limonene-1,2-epoxide hydrolase
MSPTGAPQCTSSSSIVNTSQLRALFSKPYGAPAPSEQQWREAYSEDVVFEDPTQKQKGLKAYLAAQEGLLRRCDDVLLKPLAIACDGQTAFVEWEMGLKIKGIEFVYPGTTRLLLNDAGKIVDHRDYFDFVGPTFEPVPVIGGFVRWLYKRFVN